QELVIFGEDALCGVARQEDIVRTGTHQIPHNLQLDSSEILHFVNQDASIRWLKPSDVFVKRRRQTEIVDCADVGHLLFPSDESIHHATAIALFQWNRPTFALQAQVLFSLRWSQRTPEVVELLADIVA